MAKNNKQKNNLKDSTKKVQQKSKTNAALTEFQNQEHNTQKEALGPNTKR